MQVFSIIVLVLLLLLLVALGVYLIVMRVFFHKVFGRKNIKHRLEEKSGLIDTYKIDLCWFDANKFQTLKIISYDDLKLEAHFLENEGDKIAILVHGYGCDYREMSSFAKMFFKMGHSVLLVQNRGHGKSEGNIGMGFFDSKDILLWVNVLTEKNPKCKIVLFGLSMGGAAVCMSLKEELPKNVVCAISDCAFENVFKELSMVYNPKHKKLKQFLFNSFANYMKRAYGFDLNAADCGISLKKSQIPVMIIHGKSDSFVPVENAYNLYEKLPKFRGDIYIVDDAEHAMSYAKNPYRYEVRVREFLKKWGM